MQDDQDPAINLYHKLKEKYPKVDTRLFIGKPVVRMGTLSNAQFPYGFTDVLYFLIISDQCV